MKESSAVILLNLGGPWNLEDVRPFLRRLFNDPDVLVGVPSWLRKILAWVIALFKGASSRRAYAQIGGGSPQLYWTETQAQGLIDQLAIPVEVGMRVAEPTIEQAIERASRSRPAHLYVLPLFPQFSRTMSGSCLLEFRRAFSRIGPSLSWNPTIRVIDTFCEHPGFLDLFTKRLPPLLAALQSGPGPAHLIVTAHSLPMKIVRLGDRYPNETERTYQAVCARIRALGYTGPITLAFQSRNGRMPWMEPYTDHEIKRLGREGIRSLLLVPISFVSDHIETLYELDILFKQEAEAAGILQYQRMESFNGAADFANLLCTLIRESEGAASND